MQAIYCETPTNPLLELVDMEALGKFGQQSGIITIVDTTFGPPFVQYPIQHGIDIVLQSWYSLFIVYFEDTNKRVYIAGSLY